MDGNGKKPCGGNKAAVPAPATDATQQQPARAALETLALSNNDDAAAQQVDDGHPVAASVDESRGGEGAEEEEDNGDDDEQLERFYALLANIRAMRGLAPHSMASTSSSCGGRGDTDDTDIDTAGAGDSSRNKRPWQSAEPSWWPAFRMEDFEEPPPPTVSSCKMSTKRTRGVGHDDHCRHGESSGGSAL